MPRRLALAILLALCLAAPAAAQMITAGTCAMVRTEEGDVLVGTACTLDFAGPDFDVTCAAGECNISASNNIMRSGASGTVVDLAQLPAPVWQSNAGTDPTVTGTTFTENGTNYTDVRTSSANSIAKVALAISSTGNLTGTGDTNTGLRITATGGEATSGNNRTIHGTTVGGTGTVVGSEIYRFDSQGTGDYPNVYAIQYRVAITNSTGAVDVAFFPTANDKVYHVRATVIGRCTATGGCTAGQGAGGVIAGVFKNVGGTLTQLGVNGGAATTNTVEALMDDITGTQSIAFLVSTPNLKVTATSSIASSAITWHVRLDIEELGS